MPANFAQKQEFKAMLKAMNRFVVAENFDEAMVAYTECFKKNEILPRVSSRIISNACSMSSLQRSPVRVMLSG